jgi:hypothetical protein
MTSQNIDLSFWDNLYRETGFVTVSVSCDVGQSGQQIWLS